MRTVVIAGPRHRGWNHKLDDPGLISAILDPRHEYYGNGLSVVSMGCDLGFGRDVKVYCEEHGIKFAEFVVYFNGPREKDEYAGYYNARHAALVDIGDEFHIAVTQSRQSSVEDLVSRVIQVQKPYCLYNEDNAVIDSFGDLVPVQEDQALS